MMVNGVESGGHVQTQVRAGELKQEEKCQIPLFLRTSQLQSQLECSVCEKIKELLLDPSYPIRRTHRVIGMGKLETVLDKASCPEHVPVLKYCLEPSEKSSTDAIWVEGYQISDGGVGLSRVVNGDSMGPEWIGVKLFHQWKQSCDEKNQTICQQPLDTCRLPSTCPTWLIDTDDMCLVPGSSGASYIALSYVRGKTPFFSTSKHTILQLQQKAALDEVQRIHGLPRMITDAIQLVRLLGERYLWVDALCIVQDDDVSRKVEIIKMAAIYNLASVTIIAAQGEDADYGLRGIREISKPRDLPQRTFRLADNSEIVAIRLEYAPVKEKWSQRGWTYQEGIFARRRLVFHADTVTWECGCSHFHGVVGLSHSARKIGLSDSDSKGVLSSHIPSMFDFGQAATGFNERSFTHPQDALLAFSGIMSALNKSFVGGFICGLPLVFLDVALCWQGLKFDGDASYERRLPSDQQEPTAASLPSWSWLGWKCTIDSYQWRAEADGYKFPFSTASPQVADAQIVSVVEWYSTRWDSGRTQMRYLGQQQRIAQEMMTAALEGSGEVPSGWERFEYTPRDRWLPDGSDKSESEPPPREPWQHYYKHESDVVTKFAYPVPTSSDVEADSHVPVNIDDTLLCGRTRRAWFQIKKRMQRSNEFAVRTAGGSWVGSIHAHDPASVEESGSVELSCELIVISEGYKIEEGNAWSTEAWAAKGWPKSERGDKDEWCNVLWVYWKDGVAYRKGVGKVMKSAFENEEVEWIDLVLG